MKYICIYIACFLRPSLQMLLQENTSVHSSVDYLFLPFQHISASANVSLTIFRVLYAVIQLKWREKCLPFTLSKMVNIVKEILHPLQISPSQYLGGAREAFLLSDECSMLVPILINTGIFPAICWVIWSVGHKL